MWACTKTRNGETNPPKQPKQKENTETKRNNRNDSKYVKIRKKLAICGAKTVARVFPGLLSCGDNTVWKLNEATEMNHLF